MNLEFADDRKLRGVSGGLCCYPEGHPWTGDGANLVGSAGRSEKSHLWGGTIPDTRTGKKTALQKGAWEACAIVTKASWLLQAKCH